MMKRIALYQVAVMAVILSVIAPANKCYAIPAFARKYQISCQVCHSPVMPRLKAFGDEFAGDGFRMTKYESPRYFIPTGDEKLSLFREVPIAFRFEGYAAYNFNNEGKTDFSAPFVVKILSGGELSDHISYYFYFLLNETGSIAGLEDAFLMYNNLFGSGINFYIGQFQVSDPLFKGELRYTLEPYMIYSVAPGNSTANLKYDRGIIFDKGFKTGTTLVAEIVNGCGIGAAAEGFLFDKDKYKNFMLRINQDVGKNLSIGIMGYTGKEDLADPAMVSGNVTNRINMVGPDLILNFSDKFVLNLQYIRRLDSEVFIGTTGAIQEDITTDGGFAEVIYSPKGDMSKWYLTGLLNIVESDADGLDYRSATLHAGYLLRRNVRVVTEYSYKFSGASFGRVSAGFVSAF
jgi:hypothetical protein